MTMCDSFASNLFIQSFQIFLRKDAQGHFKMGFAGQLEVKVSFGLFLSLSLLVPYSLHMINLVGSRFFHAYSY